MSGKQLCPGYSIDGRQQDESHRHNGNNEGNHLMIFDGYLSIPPACLPYSETIKQTQYYQEDQRAWTPMP